MKYFIYILLTIAAGLLLYNTTYIDLNNILGGDSRTALIGVFSSACVILLLLILLTARSIQKKSSRKK